MQDENEVEMRKSFYTTKSAGKLLARDGIPKNRKAMVSFISQCMTGKADGMVSEQQLRCLSNVSFDVHPQQINVRDRSTGKIIATIRR